MAGKRIGSMKIQLLEKSREAALNAVQSYNSPLTTFKTETFIVLMTIAWTYLLHAYYRGQGVEYRYYKNQAKRRRFERTKSGAFKYWDLAECLSVDACPLDEPTKLNLRFMIGLRNEIEHHQSTGVDRHLSGRYLACCLNYERYRCEWFGEQYSLDDEVAFTLQFRDLALASRNEVVASMPSSVAKYVREFDANLSDEDLISPYFRRRFLFVPVTVNKKAQADEVIEFVPADSDLAEAINQHYQQIMLKEVERPKFLPGQVVGIMQQEGYTGFGMHHHTLLWKEMDARNPGKGFGVQVANTWYWYERWVNKVREHCQEQPDQYRNDHDGAAAA